MFDFDHLDRVPVLLPTCTIRTPLNLSLDHSEEISYIDATIHRP